MRFPRLPLIIIVVIAAGIGWVIFDEQFGRPDRPKPVFHELYVPMMAEGSSAVKFNIRDGPIRANCVVVGDTLWYRRDKIRISDIDAPERSDPECDAERQAGEMARERLLILLNGGEYSVYAGWRDEDR